MRLPVVPVNRRRHVRYRGLAAVVASASALLWIHIVDRTEDDPRDRFAECLGPPDWCQRLAVLEAVHASGSQDLRARGNAPPGERVGPPHTATSTSTSERGCQIAWPDRRAARSSIFGDRSCCLDFARSCSR